MASLGSVMNLTEVRSRFVTRSQDRQSWRVSASTLLPNVIPFLFVSVMALPPVDDAFALAFGHNGRGAWQWNYDFATWQPDNLFDEAYVKEVFTSNLKGWEDFPQLGVDEEWKAFRRDYGHASYSFEEGLAALEAQLLKKEHDLLILLRYWKNVLYNKDPQYWNGDWNDFSNRMKLTHTLNAQYWNDFSKEGCAFYTRKNPITQDCHLPDWRSDNNRIWDQKRWKAHVASVQDHYKLREFLSPVEAARATAEWKRLQALR